MAERSNASVDRGGGREFETALRQFLFPLQNWGNAPDSYAGDQKGKFDESRLCPPCEEEEDAGASVKAGAAMEAGAAKRSSESGMDVKQDSVRVKKQLD